MEAVYGHEYCLQADEELHDVEKLCKGISGKVDKWDESSLEKFREEGSGSYMSYILLEDMCRMGIIEPGDYVLCVN